jgi:hypothetical protein
VPFPESPEVLVATAAGVVLAAGWLAYLLRFHRAGLDFPEVTTAQYPGPGPGDRVSILLAVKDEEHHVEGCVRALLAQDHPNLQVVVADDRSGDATSSILARLREEVGERLRVVRVDAVPAGWGGQNHAFHQAAQAADGDWLCFTDADCRFDTPRTVSVALADAVQHGAQFLSLLPRMSAPTPWERIYLPLCSFLFLTGLDVTDTNRADRPGASAYGPFMLIRRDAYDRLGGHVRVRDQINGDVCLARLAKAEGVPLRLAGNVDLCRTRMYRSAGAAWSGWTRNFHNSIQRPGKLLAGFAAAAGLFVGPWVGLLAVAGLATQDATWLPALAAWSACVLLIHLGLWRLYRAFSVPPAWSLLYLPGAVFAAGITARAALRALRGVGTRWHGVDYPAPTRLPS